MATIYQKVVRIREDHFHELHKETERVFIDDMYDGVDGLPSDISDEDIADYLTERQINWINDIAVSLGIE